MAGSLAYNAILNLSFCFTSGSDGMLVNLLAVVIRVVYTFHKDLAIVDLVGHCTAEQFANSRTFEIVSGTHGLSSSLKNAPMGLPFRDKRR